MTWQIVLAFFVGVVVGGVICGIIGYRIGYRKGGKEEYKKWRHVRMLGGHW